MNRILYKLNPHPVLTALLGLGIASLSNLALVSAHAGLIFVPLPSEQASIIAQSQIASPTIAHPTRIPTAIPDTAAIQPGAQYYPLPAEPPLSTASVPPVMAQPNTSPYTPQPIPNTSVNTSVNTSINTSVNISTSANGQDYYTLPRQPDEVEPLPMPEEAIATKQPDVIPFPTQAAISPSNKSNKIKTAANGLAQAKNQPNAYSTSQAKPLIKPQANTQAKTPPQAPVAPKPANKTPAETVKPSTNPTRQQESKQKPSKNEKIVPNIKKANLRFSDFPAKVYTGRRVAPKISTLKNLNGFYVEALRGTKGEKQFIDTLTKTKPNYAGHYVITSFTCGLNCSASVAYDVKTGEFMELGGGFADCPATDFNPRQKASITHQVTSRLLIVIGSSATGSCVTGYFEEKNGNVSLISQKNLMTFVP